MDGAKATLLGLLALAGVSFVGYWVWSALRSRPWRDSDTGRLSTSIAIGVLTDFLDTLGVGSFATTTSLFRLSHKVRDENIPGSLNAGHALPTLAQAFIYIAMIQVDPRTLVLMIASATAGGVVGASVVVRWPRRKIQWGMGLLLIVAALVIVTRQLGLVRGQGLSLGLEGWRLVVGSLGNFVLGVLMTLGIGLYAPCMILVTLLGMNPEAAFPIMMGSCAFLMPAASLKFIAAGRYEWRATLGLTLGGVPAVLGAAYLVKSLPLTVVQWLVVGIVVYTSIALIRDAKRAIVNDIARSQR